MDDISKAIQDARQQQRNLVVKGFQSDILQAVSDNIEKSKWNVGDIHPNGKWIFTEYKPGKFDWRNIKTSNDSKPAKPVETVKKEPTFSEKYPGNDSSFDPNSFAFKKDNVISTRKYFITNVTDKNIMYEIGNRYSSRSSRITIEEFLKKLDAGEIAYSSLPIVERSFAEKQLTESESYKEMIEDLKSQTTGLKDTYIERTKEYRSGEYDRILKKYGNYTYDDWVEKYPREYKWGAGRKTIDISPEGKKMRGEVERMKKQGKPAYVQYYAKLAEIHYKDSIEALGKKITDAGFDVKNVKLKSSSIGVNFETEVTDGNKYMRAYTIIAAGPIIAPHYRYLFTSQKKKS